MNPNLEIYYWDDPKDFLTKKLKLEGWLSLFYDEYEKRRGYARHERRHRNGRGDALCGEGAARSDERPDGRGRVCFRRETETRLAGEKRERRERQAQIPERACVRTFPVVERDNWIWVWMGDPAKADPELICKAVGPGHPDWNIPTSKVRVNTNYRLELANLSDLTHISWVHDQAFGGTTVYASTRPKHTLKARGMDTEIWLRGVPAPRFAQHLFPPDMVFDLYFLSQMSFPCNFILHFQVYAAGTATEGPYRAGSSWKTSGRNGTRSG